MDGQTLLIRADAATRMGTGHVMRCLALAQAWQAAGGRAELVTADLEISLSLRLESEGINVLNLAAESGSSRDAQDTAAIARDLGATWMVVDGYQFDAAYQQALKRAGLRLLFVDDYGHSSHYYADLVLNQNIETREALYARHEPDTRLLLGTRYALLRREFWPWRGWQRKVRPGARRVLVTLGGSDPDNVALKVLYALGNLGQTSLGDLDGLLLLGSSNPHEGILRQAIREMALRVRIERRVTRMPLPMSWADICLAAGGSTCWELALMGLPSLLFVLAENQRANAEGMQAAGAAHNLGWHRDVSSVTLAGEMERLLLSREVREAMARTGQRLVDGYGALRVVAEMSGGVVVRVRPAEQADVRLVFEWANDPLTRAMSFHPEPISWAEHERWFRRAMSTAALLFLIVEVEEGEAWTPCCQVRIDQDGTVSISIAPGYRSRGLAVPALRAAMVHSRQRGRRELKAFIKPENERSQKIFCQAGFEPVGEAEISGQRCLAYIYRYPQGAAARNE
ncbi:MAG: UDP-2,4-diacetamido-2,4,6-trideoxy-beta-L-altropyranose hydrolase [Anaerolineae bacterium]|jgi:UDP-2,4-diacetamido-2,4,6-trideoxy-beta-L-altropyranose hydrolase|nr:UDP-2,4-diacetamido-2,4,6-trideoxy-beta-L-altropyranose hydrolase [Anaerolineae bacterium]